MHRSERLRDAAQREHGIAHGPARPISRRGSARGRGRSPSELQNAPRGGNIVPPTSASPVRATLAGPRPETVVLPGSGPRSFYGYIFLSRLSGMSDVAEASIG